MIEIQDVRAATDEVARSKVREFYHTEKPNVFKLRRPQKNPTKIWLET